MHSLGTNLCFSSGCKPRNLRYNSGVGAYVRASVSDCAEGVVPRRRLEQMTPLRKPRKSLGNFRTLEPERPSLTGMESRMKCLLRPTSQLVGRNGTVGTAKERSELMVSRSVSFRGAFSDERTPFSSYRESATEAA